MPVLLSPPTPYPDRITKKAPAGTYWPSSDTVGAQAAVVQAASSPLDKLLLGVVMIMGVHAIPHVLGAKLQNYPSLFLVVLPLTFFRFGFRCLQMTLQDCTTFDVALAIAYT
jgi:hypothetical protein